MDDQKQKREELLKEITWSVFSVAGILVIFFILIIFLQLVLKIPFPVWVNFWIIFWILSLFLDPPVYSRRVTSLLQ